MQVRHQSIAAFILTMSATAPAQELIQIDGPVFDPVVVSTGQRLEVIPGADFRVRESRADALRVTGTGVAEIAGGSVQTNLGISRLGDTVALYDSGRFELTSGDLTVSGGTDDQAVHARDQSTVGLSGGGLIARNLSDAIKLEDHSAAEVTSGDFVLDASRTGFLVTEDASLTVDAGTISAGLNTVWAQDRANVLVRGGTVTSSDGFGVVRLDNESTLSLEGGQIVSGLERGLPVLLRDESVMVMTGGRLGTGATNQFALGVGGSARAEIHGGTIAVDRPGVSGMIVMVVSVKFRTFV